MRKRTIRPVLAGVFSAMLGFSFALATATGRCAGGRQDSGAAARGVGTNLRFSNPLLLPGQDPQFPLGGNTGADPFVFDLGDVCFGSQFTRYVNALGGVGPYVFATATVGTTVNSALSPAPTGRVDGTLLANGPVPSSFAAAVFDAAGNKRTGIFHLNTLNCALNTFRFAMDRLPGAQVGNDYYTNIEVLGGDPSTVFYFDVPGTVFFNGKAQQSLESLGLTLFADGMLAGRPLDSGTLVFDARAQKGSVNALNRSGTRPDQTFSITIAPAASVQSVLATTNLTIGGSAGQRFRTTMRYSAVINTDGLRNGDFGNLPFTMRFAGLDFRTRLDANGQVRAGDLRVSLRAPEGLLTVTLKNQDLGALLGLTSLDGPVNETVVIEIDIGGQFIGTEAIALQGRARRGKFSTSYRLGKQPQLGGLFQATAVKALDIGSGTAFKTRFLISSATTGGQPMSFASQATVSIGQGFQVTVPLSRGRASFAPPGLRSVRVDPRKRIADITTFPLTPAQTGIPQSVNSNGMQQTFLLGLNLTAGTQSFFGEASRQLFPVVFH